MNVLAAVLCGILSSISISTTAAQGTTGPARPSSVPAEDPSSMPPLTLAEALALALGRNEAPRVARARVEQAEAALREARGALLPSVVLSGTYTRRAHEVSREIEGDRIVIQERDAMGGLLTADADVFDATSLPEVRRSRRLLEAVRLDAAQLEREVAFDVAEAFFAVLTAESLRAASDRRADIAARTVDDARGRFDVGLAARNEVTRSELELAAARLARTTAENAVRTTRLALGFLIGEQADQPLGEPPIAAEGVPALSSKAPELERDAVSGRPDLQALDRRAEAARLAARTPRLERVPSLRLRGSYSGTNEAGLSGDPLTWNVAATLSWMLYDGGIRTARAQALEAEVRVLRLDSDTLRRRIGLEVRTALADLETSEAGVEEASIQEQVARDNADEVRELFAQGLATALEQADANVSEFEAAAELARRRFALRVAQLALLEATGDWPQAGTERP